jgi:hypothetical protein
MSRRHHHHHSFYTRIIGINEYHFILEDCIRYNRCNLHYYSEQFNEILKRHNVKVKIYSDSIIQDLFKQYKDSLTDLSWYNDGFY